MGTLNIQKALSGISQLNTKEEMVDKINLLRYHMLAEEQYKLMKKQEEEFVRTISDMLNSKDVIKVVFN